MILQCMVSSVWLVPGMLISHQTSFHSSIGETRLISFNASKTKLNPLRHSWVSANHTPIVIYGNNVKEAISFERRLGLMLIQMERVYACILVIGKMFFVELQKPPNSCCYHDSLQESIQTKNGSLLPYLGWRFAELTI